MTSDLQIASPQVTLDINRDRAQTLGVTPDQIQNALFTAYGTRQVSTIYTPSNEYQVILEVEPQYQRNPDALSKLYVRSAKGTLVPLDTVVTVQRTVGPLSVNHFGQLPAATISFNLQPGFALGDAAAAIDDVIRDLRIPPTIAPLYQGTVQAFQQSFKGLSILLIVAILVIYMVLGMLYESFIHPITILSGLPSAVFGALLTLKIFHRELDLYAFVGLIMLFGVVKKNAIMMIDFAIEAQRVEGRPPFDAIFQGCILRFRPIMMTTLAALFGTFPIALGIGAGADARQPLGLAVVGGLLFSQFITLYITPVVYLYLEAAGAEIWNHPHLAPPHSAGCSRSGGELARRCAPCPFIGWAKEPNSRQELFEGNQFQLCIIDDGHEAEAHVVNNGRKIETRICHSIIQCRRGERQLRSSPVGQFP